MFVYWRVCIYIVQLQYDVYIYIYSWCMNILRIYIYKYNVVGLTVERSVYPNWKFHRGGQRLPHDVTIIGSRCHFEPTSTVEHHKGVLLPLLNWLIFFFNFHFLVVFVVPKEFSHHVHHEPEDLSFQLVLATLLVFASWCASPGLLVISSVRKVEKIGICHFFGWLQSYKWCYEPICYPFILWWCSVLDVFFFRWGSSLKLGMV